MSKQRGKQGGGTRKQGFIVTSGAYGTELQARGLKPGESADAWNLLRPDDVIAVARAYAAAGADIITTNTFQANPMSLMPHGWHAMTWEINRAGVQLAREATAGRCLVFGSVGPIVVPQRGVPAGEAPGYMEQFDALLDAGVDGIVLETFTDVAEVVRALEDVDTDDVEVFALMTFTGEVDPATAAKQLEKAGVAGIGANCTSPGEMLPVCRALRQATRVPLWMQPSAGLPREVDGRLVYDMTPDQFADGALRLVEAGADLVGGCCGVGPEHIRALSARLHAGA